MRDERLDRFIARAREFLPESRVLTDRQALAHYCYDATDKRFLPDAVLVPVSTEEISQVMRLAHELEVPVTPQGGRTGLSGGALPVRGGVVLSFLAMNRILEIDEKNLQVVVEPGVAPADLQRELDARGLFSRLIPQAQWRAPSEAT